MEDKEREQLLSTVSGKSLQISEKLKLAAFHHVASFNYAIDVLLARLPETLSSIYLDTPSNSVVRPFQRISFRFLNFQLQKPVVKQEGAFLFENTKLLPVECRERSLTYSATLHAQVARSIDGGPLEQLTVTLGEIPIMIGSSHCHLANLTPKQLIQAREDPTEFGGFFLVNGIERIVRLLVAPKQNYPLAFSRPGFMKRGPNFTPCAVQMRCVRESDLLAQTVTLHYLSDGSVAIRLLIYKAEYLIPLAVVLKALGGLSEREIQGDDCTHTLTDLELFKKIVGPQMESSLIRRKRTEEDDSNYDASQLVELADKVESLLLDYRSLGLKTSQDCREYLGKHFRVVLTHLEGRGLSDSQIGAAFLSERICVQTPSFSDKLNCLTVMVQKLYAFVEGKVGADNLDALSSQECLLSGHVYFMLLREKLQEVLLGVKARFVKEMRGERSGKPNESKQASMTDKLRKIEFFGQVVQNQGKAMIKKVEYFLATGNLISRSNLDLQQTAGFTVVADKLNSLRYLSHFRSIHRGHYFTQMKTTTVRKLLPESWGFVCPVHTPDGAPCGLLNHISMACLPLPSDSTQLPSTLFDPRKIVPSPLEKQIRLCKTPQEFRELLNWLLASPMIDQPDVPGVEGGQIPIPVMLNGVLLCYIPASQAHSLTACLRMLKTADLSSLAAPYRVPPITEIALIGSVKPGFKSGLFPGLFLATSPGRFLRPVLHLGSGEVEWIGPLEQTHMEIAVYEQDLRRDITHQQLSPQIMLSILAGITPFSDYNQSPRNMYQCQMAKQTMGTASHNGSYRADNKSYRIMTPQLPIVRTQEFKEWQLGDHPSGTNAIVAVISYTGYDMEDAMIINRMAYERGLAHGCIYKTSTRRLNEQGGGGGGNTTGVTSGQADRSGLRFQLIDSEERRREMKLALEEAKRGGASITKYCLDEDGLPRVGAVLESMMPELCIFDTLKGKAVLYYYRDKEEGVVESVKISSPAESKDIQVQVKIRVKRNPIIGDKFSSRHGQKGVLGMLWPHEDMPFTSDGLVPDIIINPHAFPSRMTIGMLIESIAAKSGALHGSFQQFSTFSRFEEDSAVGHFGRELAAKGFQFHGNEEMYCGTSGQLMEAHIFIGVVYYQRLRHMVSDKAQARATGPVDILTRQPVKGRKHHGGIRFGEMERDALLGHGVSACLYDRLMLCSDYSEGYVCQECGSLLSAYEQVEVSAKEEAGGEGATKFEKNWQISRVAQCRVCREKGRCARVRIPFVLRYLANELQAMNIKMMFRLE